MCSANKCCLVVKLDLGCVLIGIVSFLFSVTMVVTSAVILTMKDANLVTATNATSTAQSHLKYIVHVKVIENFEIPLPTLRIILYSSLVCGLLLMVASISLIIGLNKKKPGFVLVYFGFGIFFVIFCQLGGLLMLLQKQWEVSLIIFLTSFLYIHFLVVIHTVYEAMLTSVKLHGFKSVERLLEEDTISTVSIDTSNEIPGEDRV